MQKLLTVWAAGGMLEVLMWLNKGMERRGGGCAVIDGSKQPGVHWADKRVREDIHSAMKLWRNKE
jgi:hypothetical protein